MKITICGSMAFCEKMTEISSKLEKEGHICFAPISAGKDVVEDFEKKIRNDFIYKHYEKIVNSDAILVLNYTKKDVENRIGANAFLEMGFAHVLKKKIFLLNPIPSQEFILDEVKALQPTILNGDLSKIG